MRWEAQEAHRVTRSYHARGVQRGSLGVEGRLVGSRCLGLALQGVTKASGNAWAGRGW